MSRQATKHDLENFAHELGVSFDGRPTVGELRHAIFDEFRKLHAALGALGYGTNGLGLVANQTRLKALHRAALAHRAAQEKGLL